MKPRIHNSFILLLLFCGNVPLLWGQSGAAVSDSTFRILSLPEIQSYRRYYVQELQALQEEKESLIAKGIEDGERLLQVNPNRKMVDEILIRLADLYYYQAKDDYLQRMDEFDRRQEEGASPDGELPSLDCSKSLLLYQQVIDEFPQSQLVDDAIYNKAFLYEEMRDYQSADQIYLHLIDAYPESPYVPEAYMRLAEYYFNPGVNDLERAIHYYLEVKKYTSSPRYIEAIYKLGWANYKLDKYPEAISYFTSLVEDVDLTRAQDPAGVQSRTDLRDEAISYIAICFHDFGGPAKAVEYLEKIGRPAWSADVMRTLGDVYKDQKEEYENAILAYQHFLDFDPLADDAPVTQGKIVDCYEAMDEKMKAFEARQRLFLNYRIDSSWWEAVKDESARLRAYNLTEEMLRLNMNAMIEQAEQADSPEIYRKTVEMGRQYLDTFPENPYSYMVRWNIALILDTKLHRFKDAMQEYLTICLVYNTSRFETFARDKGLATIRDAAANAVVMGDSLVQQERNTNPPAAPADSTMEQKETVPLSPAESWLAMAYDNYVKLFPFDNDNTPLILANAGALYFVHNQFSEALKYFRTLIKYFPDSEEIETVKLSILDSYFGKGDYRSAELLAKRMLPEAKDSEMRERIRARLGEAIFRSAQSLAQHGDQELAAREFNRMALEVPTTKFADRALFNAGLHYDESSDYQAAIRAYEKLLLGYPGSELGMDALNNMAVDYAEIDSFAQAAQSYLRLSERTIDAQKKQAALYNAVVYFDKAGLYDTAIESGKKYANSYPDAPDAARVFFNCGLYYLKKQDQAGAASVFKNFAERFPDSTLSMEALFRVASFDEEQGEKNEAEDTFFKTYDLGKRLRGEGREVDDFYLAEALFRGTELMRGRYEAIDLRLPAASLQRSLNEKQKLLSLLNDDYNTVISYKTGRLPEALFRLGQIYEEFAHTWVEQEIPAVNSAQRVVKQKSINTRAVEVNHLALKTYLKAVGALRTLMTDVAARQEPVDPDSLTAAGTDTVLQNIASWLGRSEEKVSETLYNAAEINGQSVRDFLEAPVPSDLDQMGKIEYRNQLLFKAVKPLIDKVIADHSRNLTVSDSLRLDNRWRVLSQVKIIEYGSLLFHEYGALTLQTLDLLQEISRNYGNMVLVRHQEAPEEMSISMINLCDQFKNFSKAALLFDREGMQKIASVGIPAYDLAGQRQETIDFSLSLVDTMDGEIAKQNGYVDQAEELFNNKEDVIFEDALSIFEDIVYFLQQGKKEFLSTAYTSYRQLPGSDAAGNLLAVKLLEADSSLTITDLGLRSTSLTVRTDSTWSYHLGLVNTDGSAVTQSVKGWKHPIANGTSLAWGRMVTREPQAVVVDTILISKVVTMAGYPLNGRLEFHGTVPERIVVNGVLITAGGKTVEIPTGVLKQGVNKLLFMCTRHRGFSFYTDVLLQYIPLPERGK